MNERIVRLIDQMDQSCIPYQAGDNLMTITDRYLEKFAELIVGECADIAKHHVMNISTYADADFVDEQIKQHFGVEE